MIAFFDPAQRTLNNYSKIINSINGLETQIKELSDTQILEKGFNLSKQFKLTENKDSLLVETFALVREVSSRKLGLRHFDTQLLGGLVLNSGKIAEMKTGEGKTLVATLPAVFNSFSGKGVHLVTVNEYLAQRDQTWMGKIYNSLGLTVGLVQEGMSTQDKKINYRADITYITNSELAFDYLRDNMAPNREDIVQRPFSFGIIDEVDSILIDEARTPLIISQESPKPLEKYIEAAEISNYLKPAQHFEKDEKSKNITLTEDGLSVCENILNVNDLYDSTDPWIPYINNAVKAKTFFIKDVDYIVKNQEVQIVDEFTGRIMSDRRWSDGLHQAVEAKEKLVIKKDTQTLASITYQSFFLLYPKLSGMTGTAKTAETELEKIYNLEVLVLPTAKTLKRNDLSDLVYTQEVSKWKSVAKECKDMYEIGRPVLVGTTSVEKSEIISQLLSDFKIPHELLNAKPENAKRESEIIAQAGRKKSITISTNMAGRGTDIILGGNAKFLAKKSLLLTLALLADKTLDQQDLFDQISVSLKFNLSETSILQLIVDYIDRNNSDYLTFEQIENGIDITDNLIKLGNPILESVLLKIYRFFLNRYEFETENERNDIKKLGGLFVIGTERHESRRIDNQLRGRAGRQGDPGTSRFFLSLDDNLLKVFGGSNIQQMITRLNVQDDIPLESNFLSQSLDNAQEKVERFYYDSRKQVFEYDGVLDKQRQIIFLERRRILKRDNIRNLIVKCGELVIDDLILEFNTKTYDQAYLFDLAVKVQNTLGLDVNLSDIQNKNLTLGLIRIFFYREFWIAYDLKEGEFENYVPDLIRTLEKSLMLSTIDSFWTLHLQKMNSLRDSIGWRGYGQKDPLVEYKNEAFRVFIKTLIDIRKATIVNFLKIQVL